jgi:rhodanese-related sulfurtransferase
MGALAMSGRNTSPALCAALLGLLGLLLPQWGWTQSYPQSVTDLVAKAKAKIRTIDMAAFKSALDKGNLGLVIDVREPGEYADGHVPGAINIPRGLIEFRIWSYVGFPSKPDMRAKITLYCRSGGRSALAAKSLQDLKFSNVTAVDMSIEDWTKAGYPLVRE